MDCDKIEACQARSLHKDVIKHLVEGLEDTFHTFNEARILYIFSFLNF